MTTSGECADMAAARRATDSADLTTLRRIVIDFVDMMTTNSQITI